MKKHISMIIATMCVAGSALADANVPADIDEALINDLARQWETAWNNGDGKAVADLYTDDGVHMVAQNTFMGHAAIEDLANVATKAGAGDLVISVEHVRSFASSVWCNGTYTMHVNGQFTRGYWSGFDVRYGNRLKIARSVSVARSPEAQTAAPL